MKPLTKDLARTGALVALATGSILIPIRLLRRSAAPPTAPKSDKLAVQTFDIAEGQIRTTIGVAINDRNDIVGTAFDSTSHPENKKVVRAFAVRNKKAALLPLPKGAPLSVAVGINDEGSVVGTVGDETKIRGVIWQGDKVWTLVSGQKDTATSTISKNGVVAGIAVDSAGEGFRAGREFSRSELLTAKSFEERGQFSVSHLALADGFSGMVWQRPGEGKSIGPFAPQGGSPNGMLVGVVMGKHGPVPAVFQSGKIGSLPQPEGLELAVPLAASDAGILVGVGVTSGSAIRPVGWSNGKTGFLPVPGGRRGMALGINDAKTVVGAIETEKGEPHAAVWKGGKVIDLNDLADKDSGWTLLEARGINNKGFVVGTAFNAKKQRVSAFVVGPVK